MNLRLLKDLIVTRSYGHIPHQNFPGLWITPCRSLSCQNLFFALAESYKSSSYYICVSHVQVIGRPLLPAFDVEILDDAGKCSLKYCPEERLSQLRNKFSEGESSSPRFHRFRASLRGWEQMILNTLLGAGADVVDDDSDEEYGV
ncbi:hypothetical protein K7X08_035149 [Anisodus acutangulus]|uniref:Uncharacterized protein n=1 Tax=Anisodus acutangulus TaxID=402998 RepID=A0A9Q1R2B1_9SOLA|nr:hypothetical protein K7X08_035149 [Anisodus acutangulus]